MSAQEELGRKLEQISPPGRVWPRVGTIARRVMEGLAGRLAEAERRSNEILTEIDPRTTTELLPDYERLFGLPTGCVTVPQTIVERRAAVFDRMTSVRGASPAELIDLARRVAPAASIIEYRPFVAGSNAGDYLTNGSWLYTFTLQTVEEPYVFFRTGTSGAGDALVSLTRATLECLVGDAAPAQTVALFDYTLPPDVSYQPWTELAYKPKAVRAVPTTVAHDFEG